ncbi:putative vacuolar membrane transporter for cationic amino acids [Coemansia sp. RSA 2675]|nr:putative vacuolar membrane transporter for cationic amino acids [Coemansia sp. RSA 2675]
MEALISSFFGYMSIACWVVVLVPQIYLNYRRKSCDGVSLAFYLMWSLGDLFNLAGALLGGLIFTATLLPAYYLVTDCIVLSQFYIYRHANSTEDTYTESSALLAHTAEPPHEERLVPKRICLRPRFIIVALSLVLLVATFTAHYLSTGPEWLNHVNLRHVAAQFCGYASATVYLSAYVPQLVENYRSKSTEGLSMLMFIIVILANTTFCLSVLTFQRPTYEYLRKYASWLLGAFGTVWLELAVLYQFYCYRGHRHYSLNSSSTV